MESIKGLIKLLATRESLYTTVIQSAENRKVNIGKFIASDEGFLLEVLFVSFK